MVFPQISHSNTLKCTNLYLPDIDHSKINRENDKPATESQRAFGSDYIDDPSIYDEGSAIFDLSEADFRPSIIQHASAVLPMYKNEQPQQTLDPPTPQALKVNYDTTSQEGYFVPEGGSKCDTFDGGTATAVTVVSNDSFMKGSFPVGDEAIGKNPLYNDNSSLSTLDNTSPEPEILQAASELQAHLSDSEDRPSFMSSSPPPTSCFTHGPPDVIPQGDGVVTLDTTDPVVHKDNQGGHDMLPPKDNGLVTLDTTNHLAAKDSPGAHGMNKVQSPVKSGDGSENRESCPMPNVSDSMNLYEYGEVSPSMYESGDVASNEIIDQQYNIVSSVPDIARDELKPDSYTTTGEYMKANQPDLTGIKEYTNNTQMKQVIQPAKLNETPEVCDGGLPITGVQSSNIKPDVTLSCTGTQDTEDLSSAFSVCEKKENMETRESENRKSLTEEVTPKSDKKTFDGDKTNNNSVLTVCNDSNIVMRGDFLEVTQVSNSEENALSDKIETEQPNLTEKESSTDVSEMEVSEQRHPFDQKSVSNEQHSIGKPEENNSEKTDENSSTQGTVGNINESSEEINVQSKQSVNKSGDNLTMVTSTESELPTLVTDTGSSQQNMEINTSVASSEVYNIKSATYEVVSQSSIIEDNLWSDSVDLKLAMTEAENDLAKLETEIAKHSTEKLDSPVVNNTTSHAGDNLGDGPQECVASKNVKDSVEVSGDINTRRDSGGSIERFLAPSVMSPGIATPMEDAGFTKIPGFTPEVVSIPEHETEPWSNDMASDNESHEHGEAAKNNQTNNNTIMVTTSSGARPKDVVVPSSDKQKKNRPNSLLGLSTPNLPAVKLLDTNDQVSPSDSNVASNVVASEINPMYVSSMQRPGVPNRVAARPNSLVLQNGAVSPGENDGEMFTPNRTGTTVHDESSQIPRTPPPAYSLHPQGNRQFDILYV